MAARSCTRILRIWRRRSKRKPARRHANGKTATGNRRARPGGRRPQAGGGRSGRRRWRPRGRRRARAVGRRHRSVRVPARDLRAGDLRRLLRRVVGDAGPAHAADGGHKRHLVGHRGRRAARGRPLGLRAGGGLRFRGVDARRGQHLRRVSRHPAHAGDVQEEREVMSVNLASFLYLVSGILFILALRGLSHPTTSRQGNVYGMVGMAIAILTPLALAPLTWGRFGLIVVGLAIGGAIGAIIARRIAMTAMPQLVAAFHSLVGLAAVMVAAAALYAPESFGIGTVDDIHGQALIEMSIGVAIGAVTFTGSVIAFLKLDGRMSGKPILLPMRHVVNAALGIALVALIVLLVIAEAKLVFWLIVLAALALGVLIIIPIGGADMPVVVSMLNSYSGW